MLAFVGRVAELEAIVLTRMTESKVPVASPRDLCQGIVFTTLQEERLASDAALVEVRIKESQWRSALRDCALEIVLR